MRLIKLLFVATAAIIFAIACGGGATNQTTSNSNTAKNTAQSNSTPVAAATPDELAAAKKIYSEKCVKCHKENGTGGVTEIDGEKIKAPDFTAAKLKDASDNSFVDTITNGAKEDGMPAFKGKLTDDEIKSMVKLIRKEFQQK